MADAQTPTPSSAVRPPLEEMHPSKVQQSTTKRVDSGMILGFNPIQKDANGNIVKNSAIHDTPSKLKPSPVPTHYGTPGYEFKRGQESQLSDEAKQLMDSVRGEVARIKAQMIHDKVKQDQREHEAESMHGDRKIAKPKGQAGRFSDVHMAEFKKMDSIAGHPSSFRATPGRFQPVTKSLKRTKSKAQLDEPEPQNSSPSRSVAKQFPETMPTITTPTAKRAKPNPTESPSVIRSQVEKDTATKKIARARPRPRVTSSLMTPTRASMARSGPISLKAPKTSLIPSLARSPSTKGLAAPRTPRTQFNPRFKSSLPTLSNLKSILRKRQPLFSRDPAKIAAGTHVAASDFNPDSLFGTRDEQTDSAPTPSPKKHVEFTPSVKSRYDLAQASPSRSKIVATPSRSNASDIVYPTLPTLTPDHNAVDSGANEADTILSPTIRQVRKSSAAAGGSTYPELPVVAHGIAHGIGSKKRHRDQVDDEDLPNTDDTENVPPVDSLGDERSSKRLKKSIPPTPSPVKSRLIKTPVRSSSIRMGTSISTTAEAKQKPRGVLSLSRLNMLAKPKGNA